MTCCGDMSIRNQYLGLAATSTSSQEVPFPGPVSMTI